MIPQEKPSLISISELSQITGVNSVTLRAWERRYGLLKPQRSEKGHRLYMSEDIEKVTAILAWINKGVSVGKVKPLLNNEADVSNIQINEQWNKYQRLLKTAAAEFNEAKITSVYQKITRQYPLSICVNYCLKPLFDAQDNNPWVSSEQYFLMACLKSRMRHTLMHLDKSHNQHARKCVMVSHLSSTSWKVLIAALLLQEKGIKVHVFDEITAMESCIQLIIDMTADYAIIYTDAHADIIDEKHSKTVEKHNNIYLAGHKLWLAKDQGHLSVITDRVILSPIDMCTHISELQKTLKISDQY